MPAFHFDAITRTGETESGGLDAPSRAAALRQLRERGLHPVKLTEGSAATVAIAKAQKKRPANTRLNAQQLVVFTEELSELVDAGLQLEPALKIVESREEE